MGPSTTGGCRDFKRTPRCPRPGSRDRDSELFDERWTKFANRRDPVWVTKITGLANGTALTDGCNLGQSQSSVASYAVCGGSSNTYTLTLSPALTAYAAGQTFQVEPNHTNTGAATININSLGAKAIKDVYGAALVGNELDSGGIYTICYDGTDFLLVNTASHLRTTQIRKVQFSLTHNTWTQLAFVADDVILDTAGISDHSNEKITLPTGTKTALISCAIQTASGGLDSAAVMIGYQVIGTTPAAGTSAAFVSRVSAHDTLPGSGPHHTAVSHVISVPNPDTGNDSYDIYGAAFVDITAGSGTQNIAYEISVVIIR